MSKYEKLLLKILSGTSDTNIGFDELRNFLLTLGFTERMTGGSHHIFHREGIEEIINIQTKESKAKPYQVKQVRAILLKYKLAKHEDES
ncbi:type II toxin-antitoxin system HicA family toxin [Rufibacter sp. XAAS-G3-1]|uniref:type II toxin-antitoxin system HicA family toxin n=1 Tax=Rufibacter sp. XAAS-G3-1 TaxID=2729134 RepID=UPI0015E715B3|nr:type II toxin-antitoxin system HicA family toxin [Rufibacter sp. XAAS-G3-1]